MARWTIVRRVFYFYKLFCSMVKLTEHKIVTTNQFPFENLIMDFILLACYYFFLNDLIHWQTNHLIASGWITIVLNIATAAFGILTFFSIYSEEYELKTFRAYLNGFQGAVIGISALITFVAAFWWLVPYQAIKNITGFGIYNGLTMLVYFVVCLLVMAEAMNKKKYYKFSKTRKAGFISVLLNGIFFLFSYGLLIASLRIWNPEHSVYQILGIGCLVIFYLPFRIFLLLRPPFHKIEMASVFASFILMVMHLLNTYQI